MIRELNPGGLEQLVLLAISHLGENAYGVPIQREVEDRTGKSVAPSAIYITLDRLTKKGYVSSRLGESTPERGGKAKRYFKMTGLGESALKESSLAVSKIAGWLKPNLEGSGT